MKKLLLAVFSLISIISYSQTTGYFRYDTVRLEKVGSNTTLVIRNATKDSLGFLYNYGGGRTKFEVIRSVPGGIKVGEDTIIVDQSDLSDRLISGGEVTYSGTGLKFYISPAVYVINQTIYTTDYDSVTLSAADPDDPRKDVIYLATTGVEVKTGTPAGPAAEPQMDIGEIKLTVIDIQALATTPSLTTNVIWDEGPESVVTAGGTVPPTVDTTNTTNVYHLTRAIEVTSINTGDFLSIQLPSTINLAAFQSISLFIKPKAGFNANLGVSFYNGSTVVSSAVLLGYTKTSTSYHGVSLPLSRFTFANTFVDKIIIQASAASVAQAGFYLDYITLVSGFLQPGGGGSTPLAVGPIDGKSANPNGLTIDGGYVYQQTATQTYPGLLSPADKTKLDSLRSDYFIDNVGDGEELATQVNDSTVGIKSLQAGTGVTLASTDTTVTINATAGSQTLQQVFNTQVGGSILTKSDSIIIPSTNSLRIYGQYTPLLLESDSSIALIARTRHSQANLFFGTKTSTDSSNLTTDFTLQKATTGLAQNGLGSRYSNQLETSAGFLRMASEFQTFWNNATDANRTSFIRFRAANNGADDTVMTIQPSYVLVNNDDDTLSTRAYARSVGGGSSYTDADARAAISLTTTGTSGAATYNSGTGVLNVPDYSGGAAIWSGTVLGTTFSATTATVNNGAVQWTFTGSSPTTFTLPARTSSVNQFYTFKNLGSATLTIAAAGTDDIFTTSSVTSVAILPGESIMITGAANGTSDLWTALFHTGIANLLVDSLGADGISPVTTWNNTVYGRRISISGGTIDTTASGGLLLTIPSSSGTPGGSNTEVQFNNAGAFGGSANFTWSGSQLVVKGAATNTAGLDIWNGAHGSILLGGDANAATRTNTTSKNTGIAMAHYTNAEEPFIVIRASSSSAANLINYGAGVNPGYNSATGHDFYTATNNTTLAGTLRFSLGTTTSFFNNTSLGIGVTSPSARLHLMAGSTGVGAGPQKFTAGSILTTPESGVLETNSSNELYYSTSTTAASRGFVSLGRYAATATSLTADATQNVIDVTATGQTITLPTAVGIRGRTYTIKLTASGSGTVATTSSQTIDGSTTYSLSAQYKYVTVMSDNANWIIIGNN